MKQMRKFILKKCTCLCGVCVCVVCLHEWVTGRNMQIVNNNCFCQGASAVCEGEVNWDREFLSLLYPLLKI